MSNLVNKCEDYNRNPLIHFLEDKALKEKKPLSAYLSISADCNQNCKMCGFVNRDDKESELTLNQWICLAEQMKKYGVLFITLTGGEPTYSEIFLDFYKRLCLMGFKVKVKTNATLMKSKALQNVFIEFPPDSVFITLYGSTPETYYRVTGNKEGLASALEAIPFFLSLKSNLFLTMTVSSINYTEIDGVQEIANKFGQKFLLVTSDVHPNVYSGIHSGVSLSPVLRVLTQYRYELNNIGGFDYVKSLLEESLRLWKQPEITIEDRINASRSSLLCYNALLGVFIDYNGRMYYCQSYRIHYCEPLIVGFAEAWEEMRKRIESFFPSSPYCEKCVDASHCRSRCPSRAYISNQRIDEPAMEVCQYAFLERIVLNILKEGVHYENIPTPVTFI